MFNRSKITKNLRTVFITSTVTAVLAMCSEGNGTHNEDSEGPTDADADAGTDAGSDVDTNGDSTFHIFLLLGQSNMTGYPKIEEGDAIEDERIRVLGFEDCEETGRVENEWDIATPPLHECEWGAIGPGDYFSKAIIDRYPEGDTVGLVPCGKSGRNIESFMKDGGLFYDWIVQRARIAQDEGGVIEGLLFHQGESNCGDSAWPEKVAAFIADLKADLGLEDIPFLAGELLYGGDCERHNPLVAEAVDLVPNGYLISAEGLTEDTADTVYDVHFDHESQITLGTRYAQTMIDVLGL